MAADATGGEVLAALRATPPPVRYLLGGVLLNQTAAFVQTFLVLYLTVALGWPLREAAVVLTLYSTGAVFGTVLGGELASRLGPRLTIAAAMAVSALSVGVLPAAAAMHNVALTAAVAAVAGLATQAYRPAAAVLLSDLMPESYRVMSFSMMRIALNAGAAIGPLLAALLILVDWALLFWVDAFTALAYAGLALAALPRTAPSPATAAELKPTTSGARGAYGLLFTDRRYMLYLAGMLFSAAVYVQYTVILPLKVAEEGYPTGLYSAALITSSVVLISCELKVTAYVRHRPPRSAAGVGTTLLTLGIAGYGLIGLAPAVVLLSTLVFVSGLMISGPTMFAYPAQAPGVIQARYIASSQAVFSIGMAVGPAVGILLWGALGDGVWVVFLIVGLLSAGSAWVGMKDRPAAQHAIPAPASS